MPPTANPLNAIPPRIRLAVYTTCGVLALAASALLAAQVDSVFGLDLVRVLAGLGVVSTATNLTAAQNVTRRPTVVESASASAGLIDLDESDVEDGLPDGRLR